MDFTLSQEHQEFADSVARFAKDKLAPGALERAHSPHYPWETARMLSEQGLLGITFSEEDGGQGGTLMHAVLAIQQVALHCPKSADIVQAGNFGPIRTFVEYASPEQKQRFLPDLLGGKKLISLGMTEPDAGSAVTELKTSATEVGDHSQDQLLHRVLKQMQRIAKEIHRRSDKSVEGEGVIDGAVRFAFAQKNHLSETRPDPAIA